MKKIISIVAIAATMVVGTATLASAHHNTITGSAVCNRTTGEFDVQWNVQNSESDKAEVITTSNRPDVVFPGGPNATVANPNGGDVIAKGVTAHFYESVPGNTFSLTLTLGSRWSNGVTNTASGSVSMGETECVKDVINPSAKFSAPCGDPFYAAKLNNKLSNVSVTFTVSYTHPQGVRSFDTTVGAGGFVKTKYFHVKGGTLMTITANGEVLRSKTAAKGGFGDCPPPAQEG